MSTPTRDQKEQLVQDILAIQRAELQLTLAAWKARGMSRKKLRQAGRELMRKAEVDTRHLVASFSHER